jgi:MFS family permease
VATPTIKRPDEACGGGQDSTDRRRQAGLRVVIFTMAVACGLTVANLYYVQPLLVPVATALHIGQGTAATVVTATQLGYAAGLALLVPLGDVLANRKLACRTLLVTAVALAVAGLSPDFTLFLVMSVAIGVTSVVVQILVPFAAHIAPADQRGKYVGRVMSGLLLGVLLARSVASVAAAAWGWRSGSARRARRRPWWRGCSATAVTGGSAAAWRSRSGWLPWLSPGRAPAALYCWRALPCCSISPCRATRSSASETSTPCARTRERGSTRST